MWWTETDSGSWQRRELILSRWELAAAPSVLPVNRRESEEDRPRP